MYSRPANSSSRPSTSLLLALIALTTSFTETSYAASLFGSRFTWYCLTNPPMLATSATPGTLASQ
jgi:hypothetical protein